MGTSCRVPSPGSLGLPDQPERSTTEVISDYIADRTVLVLLDNCGAPP